MKVFVVIDEFVYQMENGVFVKVFLNYKSAKKYFDDTVKRERKTTTCLLIWKMKIW